MSNPPAIIEMGVWLQTPPGRYLMAWEQARFDQAVADVFGFHALQLGLPEMDALRANRMPHRWLAHDSAGAVPLITPQPLLEECTQAPALPRVVALNCLPEALPFADQSLDLVLLPHTLEQVDDPHQSLAEVVRVLRPEGRLVLSGFNPLSLWGARQQLACWTQRLHAQASPRFLPPSGDHLSPKRVRDWLRLLSCELEAEHLGCYRPPLHTEPWLERWAWMDGLGPRWWSPLGAVYVLVAVKRVRGMRLVGLARSVRRTARAAPMVVSRRRGGQFSHD